MITHVDVKNNMAQRKAASSGKRQPRASGPHHGHVPRKMMRLDEAGECSRSVVKDGFLKGSIVRIKLKNFL